MDGVRSVTCECVRSVICECVKSVTYEGVKCTCTLGYRECVFH